MLWFNVLMFAKKLQRKGFQYILCYGSTQDTNKINNNISISIHLMLWFNRKFLKVRLRDL